MSLAGFAAGFLFTFIIMIIGSQGTQFQRVTRSPFPGLVIDEMLVSTHITVFGYVLLFGIRLSLFAFLLYSLPLLSLWSR